MSDAFSDTQQSFAHHIKDGRVCHTLLPTLNKFEKVSDSPTQRRELKINSDILDLFWNRIPNISHMPMSLKETVAVEQSLKSGLESHNFLTWSVVALIRSLHEKKLLPMDDPVSPSCRSPFQRPVAVWLRASTSNALFVTLKRRHLLLSLVVPSVSDAQKNLLLDPFFQKSSLFSSSSVEAACSALVTCPCLSHILRPPCRRLHLVVHHVLALRPREALLDNFFDNLLRSDPLPLSDCSLARRAIHASRRSPPQSPTTGRL